MTYSDLKIKDDIQHENCKITCNACVVLYYCKCPKCRPQKFVTKYALYIYISQFSVSGKSLKYIYITDWIAFAYIRDLSIIGLFLFTIPRIFNTKNDNI